MPTSIVTPVQPTVDNTHISSNFGKLLEPGLRKIFFETYGEIPEEFSKIYNVNKSKKAKETDYGLGAFSDWVRRESGLDPVAYDTLSAGDERVYIHRAFTKGFMIERELYDDEQYNQIAKFPKALARSGRAFLEKNAITTLTDGFNHNIYDGKPLFSEQHPLVDSSDKGCNLMSGELNEDNLKLAMKMMREQVDEAGNLIQARATDLIIPPALEFYAKELLHSAQLPDTDLNNINSVKGTLNIIVMDWLSESSGGSDTCWFLRDKNLHQLNFFWRVKPEFKSHEDFDTFVAKYRGYMRFSHGVSDWRGWVGSKGEPSSTGGGGERTTGDLGLSVGAVTDASTDLLGKVCTDLQDGINVGVNNVTGTSKYVTGYTGYSGDVSEQSGNYIAFLTVAEDGATIKVETICKDGSVKRTVTLDSDGINIFRMPDADDTNPVVMLKYIATKGNVTQVRIVKISDITRESAA